MRCRDTPYIWLLLATAVFVSGQGPAWNATRGRAANIKLRVDTGASRFNCSRSFLSLGLPHLHYKWDAINFSSPRIQRLAAALSPASVRIYGTPILTGKDARRFEKEKRNLTGEDGAQSRYHHPDQILITAENWQNAVKFCRQVGWSLMVDFTAFFHKDGKWVSKFAKSLLDRASMMKIHIPDFQLGNGKSSKIIGPDVTRLRAVKYLKPFLQANGCDYVDEISFHHYYFKKEATLSTFLNPDILDTFTKEVSIGTTFLENYDCHKPLRLTETSSSVGGGTARASDAFVAGFSWMDKLSQASQLGITKIYRHTFFGSNYALISKNLAPNPDFYLSLMFKRYVEGPVFTVSSELPRHIRAYANCAREYPPGALIVYLMNLSDRNEYINFTQFHSSTLSVYSFTAHKGNLQSRKILLNGERLEMVDGSLPVLKESRELWDDIQIPPYSYAFVVVTHAKTPACVSYFREVHGQAEEDKVTERPTGVESTTHPAAGATDGKGGAPSRSGVSVGPSETEPGPSAKTEFVTMETGTGETWPPPNQGTDRPSTTEVKATTPREDYGDTEGTDKPVNVSALLQQSYPKFSWIMKKCFNSKI
ncbi:hypothetical protein Btru_007208 [Bulinus truncatus]|nr:hypothetical protein Btru_007208 [Bulinus truncatus]